MTFDKKFPQIKFARDHEVKKESDFFLIFCDYGRKCSEEFSDKRLETLESQTGFQISIPRIIPRETTGRHAGPFVKNFKLWNFFFLRENNFLWQVQLFFVIISYRLHRART